MSMRKSEPVGKLPRTFISFRCLEKKPNVQKRSQTKEDQQLVISTPSTTAETSQILGRDRSPMKTLTVLQSARPGCNTDEK